MDDNRGNKKITLTIDSNYNDTVLVAMSIRGICAITSLSSDDINRIELSLIEVVNNAIEHAYGGMAGNAIEVRLELVVGRSIHIVVSDWGESMDKKQLNQSPKLGSRNPTFFLESGRGLSIVKQLMDEVHYSVSEDGKNSFSMKRLL